MATKTNGLKDVFDSVVALVQNSSSEEFIPDEVKLNLYGLFKRSTCGMASDCELPGPAMWNIVATRKRNAWKEYDCIDADEAMESYIQLVCEFENHTGDEARILYKEYLRKKFGSNSQKQVEVVGNPHEWPTKTNRDDHASEELSLIQKLTGIKPFLPRGQLDISYYQLMFALSKCIRPNLPFLEAPMRATIRLENEIEELWTKQSKSRLRVITGLSVRSLVDLLLLSKSYARGSEVIIVPPIGIEGMMDVIQYHGLKIVPVDIPDYEIDPIVKVDIEKVMAKVTRKTVAVLVVHPFGLICMKNKEVQKLRYALDESTSSQKIEIWEDCAECYSGTDRYQGSEYSDIHFFSFGTIKTATCLGGGICTLNHDLNEKLTNTYTQMKRMQHTMHLQQTNFDFFHKIAKAIALNVFSRNPILLGTIVQILSIFRLDYDRLVTSAVKGFPAQIDKEKFKTEKEWKLARAQNLIQRLRRCPSPALLALLSNRLKQSSSTSRTVDDRVKRCKKMAELLKKEVPNIGVPNDDGSQHLYWLMPILVKKPLKVFKDMASVGYDVPNGTSQLGCVTSFLFDEDESNSECCPNTERMMNDILYLPTASIDISKCEMKKLVTLLRHFTERKTTENAIRKVSKSKWSLQSCGFFVVMIYLLVRNSKLRSDAMLLIRILSHIWLLLSMIVITLHILRTSMGKFYLQCSKSFAKYSDIVVKRSGHKTVETFEGNGCQVLSPPENLQQTYDLNLHTDIAIPDFGIVTSDKYNKVVLTGATGFIGSLLLRELLMHRKRLHISGGVILIIRSKRNESALLRAKKLMSKEMFSFLSDNEKDLLVQVVEGDVSKPKLGMNSEDYQKLRSDENISHVINSAACVNFTEPLPRAAESNITSALQLQELFQDMVSSPKYIYLSTAFVHGARTGSPQSPLQENLFDFGKYDPLYLYQSMLHTQSAASAAMNQLGFPNTYTFSKSICEHLLLRNKKVSTTIVRPCIVGPAVQEPFEGWAGDKPSTLVAGACLYLKNPYNLWSFRKERAAVIPVDVVCRFVIAKAFETSGDERAQSTDEESVNSSEESYIFAKESRVKRKEIKIGACRNIYTAAWNHNSPASSQFQWYAFACAIVQLACAKGHVGMTITYLVLLISFRLFLALNLSLGSFRRMHTILVRVPFNCVRFFCDVLKIKPSFLRDFERLVPFLNLPILFFPFTSYTFCFQSELHAPKEFNAERYMFSCILAAEKFVEKLNKNKTNDKNSEDDEKANVLIAGSRAKQPFSDLLWSLTQPRGNYAIRLIGWVMIKILRLVSSEVTVDMESLSNVVKIAEERRKQANSISVLIAPTHRSYFDFVLISFITFAMPELGLSIPLIAAADDFSKVPVIGFMSKMAGAFFLKRGKGFEDPALREQIIASKKTIKGESFSVLEVFLEGKRSRDRRFVTPKTGFLKSLSSTKGENIVLPITINYESLPEQACLANEVDGDAKGKMSFFSLLAWMKSVFREKVQLGKIHIVAASPIQMDEKYSTDMTALTSLVQSSQKGKILVSRYHIRACASILDVDPTIVTNSIKQRNICLWKSDYGELQELPHSLTERWAIFLHFGHYYAGFLGEQYKNWALWLGAHQISSKEEIDSLDDDTMQIISSLRSIFDEVDNIVEDTLEMLKRKGYKYPTPKHVLQYCRSDGMNIPTLLYNASISVKITKDKHVAFESLHDREEPATPLFENDENSIMNEVMEQESFGSWGYKDSGFVVHIDDRGKKIVSMKGRRYQISGRDMPRLIPFLEGETGIRLDPNKTVLPKSCKLDISQTSLSSELIKRLDSILSNDSRRLSTSDIERARHGTGHSQEDMYMIRTGGLSSIRLPDVVVYPETENEVKLLVSLAVEENLCLIPFGGGTNVTHATWCPSEKIDSRPMISVDMKRMNKILKFNEEDCTLHVQAGITGADLVREISSMGYTIGHEPDSIEFSTLGGWIATKASGMKQNKYGNIEGIVKEVRVISSSGDLWQHDDSNGASFARVSTGTDLTSIVLGSEGSLGIITSAVVKVWPLPNVKDYESVILHSFEDGLLFMKEVSRLGALKPASVRLLDNTQFRLGQALRSNESMLEIMKKNAKKIFISLLYETFQVEKMVCATITFEGSKDEVNLQRQNIRKLSIKYGGICAGREIGRAGYDMTYAIAYIRDFAMTYGFLAESFETFVPWSKLRSMISATKERLKKEHEDRALPGKPIITCRITQLYDEGVCVYFYFCMNFENVRDPSSVFAMIESAARTEILVQGGSLSHHHGIGKHRASMMDKVNSEDLRCVLMKMKEAVDPANVFGVRNGSYSYQNSSNTPYKV